MDVRTGNFWSVPALRPEQPDQAVARFLLSWALEGRDFARITGTAARVTTMAIGQVGFGLSREQALKVERDPPKRRRSEISTQAADFDEGVWLEGLHVYRAKWAVNSNSYAPGVPRAMAMEAKATMMDALPMAVEAGITAVTVECLGIGADARAC